MPKDDKKEKDKDKKEETKRVVPKTVEIKEEEKPQEEKSDKKEEETKTEEETKDDAFEKLDEPEKKSGFPWLIFVLTFIFAAAGGVGGYFAYQKGLEKGKELAATPTPIVVSSPTPTASSAAELKRSDLTLEVLNGTGESGLASEAKSFLEDKGYTVSKIDNADVFGATETQISIKDSKKGYIDLLKNDLSEKYPVASDSTGLSEDSAYDAVITVGQ